MNDYLTSPHPVLVPVLAGIVAFTGCSPIDEVTDERQLHYFQSPPLAQVDELEELINGVTRILVSAHYDSYFFEEEQRVSLSDIEQNPELLEEAETSFDIETKAGTGIIIDVADGYPLILTTNHLIDQPDTLEFYFEDDFGDPLGLGELAIAERKERYLPRDRHLGALKLLAQDPDHDIAMLTTENPFGIGDDMNNHTIVKGDARRLDWGSKVFTIGYPLGNLMLSASTVSEPDRVDRGRFTIDALFNPGFSGGAVFAMNNSTSELELVGMARSASASSDFLLRPQQGVLSPYQDGVQYDGPVFAEYKSEINYGIVYSITINVIEEFLEDNREILDQYGFDPFD